MSSRHLLVVALWVGSVVIAVVLTQPSETQAPSHAPPVGYRAREARFQPAAAPPSQVASLDSLRQVIREEIAAAQREAEAPDDVGEPDVATEERLAAAKSIVRGVIDSGRWTNASRDQLRARMSDLPRAELDQVLTELFVALNADRVRVEVDGPLL